MYSNIGKKIKGLAVGVCVAEAIGAVICGILLCIEEEAFVYVLISIFGPIVAWVSSWLIYGFGEFVDKIGKTIRCTSSTRATRGRKEKNRSY